MDVKLRLLFEAKLRRNGSSIFCLLIIKTRFLFDTGDVGRKIKITKIKTGKRTTTRVSWNKVCRTCKVRASSKPNKSSKTSLLSSITLNAIKSEIFSKQWDRTFSKQLKLLKESTVTRLMTPVNSLKRLNRWPIRLMTTRTKFRIQRFTLPMITMRWSQTTGVPRKIRRNSKLSQSD